MILNFCLLVLRFFFFINPLEVVFFGLIELVDLLDRILIGLLSLNLFKEFLINIDQSKKFNLFTNSFIISSNKVYLFYFKKQLSKCAIFKRGFLNSILTFF